MDEQQQLLVVSVSYKDVLGAESFAMSPGQITIVSGKNGCGKTTALQAVQAALGGGSLAKLARVDPSGAPTEPEVVVVIEGEGSEAYRVERSGDKVRARGRVGDTAAFEDIPRPQAWLSSLFDPAGANPVKFLTAADKDRALMLLEALPLRFDRGELLLAMGITADELRNMGAIPAGLHPLEEVGLIRDAVFRTRTGVNRDKKAQEASAEQLRRSMPAVLPDDLTEEIERAQAEVTARAAELARATEAADATLARDLAAAGAELDVTRERVGGEFKTRAAHLRREHQQRAAEIRAQAERAVQEDLAITDAAIGELKDKSEAVLDTAVEAYNHANGAAHDRRESTRLNLDLQALELAHRRELLVGLRAQAAEGERARALHDQVERFDRAAVDLEVESERLTSALEALDEYRRRLAEDLPIPGLAISGKEIRVNGVLFEQLNAAQRVGIAVKVATLRARGRRLPVVFVDGGEQLDAEHFQALVAELKASGVQAFIAKVTDEPLKVEVA